MIIAVAFFLFGLIIGSFLNVVVYRLREEKNLWGRSFCPHCQKQISWYDNIPVFSFLILGGKCRHCRKKISWQYPSVEIFTGLIFALIGFHFFELGEIKSYITTFFLLGVSGALIVILVYDWLYMEIPGVVLWSAILWTVIFNLLFDWNSGGSFHNFFDLLSWSGIIGAIPAFSFFFLLSALSHEKWMGMGDAYLAILIGLVVGWPKIIFTLFLAFLLGAVYGIILMILKRKKMSSQMPFAPFLIGATFLIIFFYTEIFGWYWKLLFFPN